MVGRPRALPALPRSLRMPISHPRRHLADALTAPSPAESRAMFLGVSTLLFDDGETAVLTDGFFSRPGVVRTFIGRVRPDKRRIEAALARAGIDKLAAVFVVHSHYDH